MVDPKPELFRSSKGTEIAELHGNNIATKISQGKSASTPY